MKLIALIILCSYLTSCSSLKPTFGTIVYLHGMGTDPLYYEQDNIKEMKKVAESSGYRFQVVEAGGKCFYLLPPKPGFKCWDHLNIENQLNLIYKKIEFKGETILIGYSNGGYFLGGALERGLLSKISKIGIISGGSIKSTVTLNSYPKVFIENASNDIWNKEYVSSFYKRISSKLKPNFLKYRVIERSHKLTPEQSSSFLKWVLEN